MDAIIIASHTKDHARDALPFVKAKIPIYPDVRTLFKNSRLYVTGKGKQKEQKRARRAKRALFALLACFCLFCFPAVFFTASLNKQKCPDIRKLPGTFMADRKPLLQQTDDSPWNEIIGLILIGIGLVITIALLSYSSNDPSWNSTGANGDVRNLIGPMGAKVADGLFQAFGLAAFMVPLTFFWMGLWEWKAMGLIAVIRFRWD